MAVIRRLGLGIVTFAESEFLETQISEIRDQIDYVVVCWQQKSYCGNPVDPEDYKEILRLKENGLIDELMEFVPNMSVKDNREEECRKRNLIIQRLKERGCSHHLIVDSDELYDAEQFRKAKEMINKNGWSVTYCSYVNYYKDFCYQLIYPFRPGVPFICSTHFNFTYNGPAPLASDPTRRVMNPMNIGTYIYEDDTILMCHCCWIRKDIKKKLVNWSAKDHFSKELIDKAVMRWESWKENEDGTCPDAIMLFNVPGNQVHVKKLDPPIHKFKASEIFNKNKEESI